MNTVFCRIAYLLPLLGMLIGFALVLSSPREWEGFGWNPASILGIGVFLVCCVLSLLLLLFYVSAKLIRSNRTVQINSKDSEQGGDGDTEEAV